MKSFVLTLAVLFGMVASLQAATPEAAQADSKLLKAESEVLADEAEIAGDEAKK